MTSVQQIFWLSVIIGNTTYTKMSVDEESEEFIKKWAYHHPTEKLNNSAKETLEKELGRIGMGCFRKLDFWLLDFPRSSFIVIRNL